MNDQAFIEIERRFNLIKEHLGSTFTLEELLDFIAGCRGKEDVVLVKQPLPPGQWAYCFAFRDKDLIVVRENLDPLRQLTACLHECSHFLLRHIPRVSAGPTTATFAEFQHHGNLREAVYHAVIAESNMYTDPQEWSAETLATLLADCIKTDDEDIPQLARDLYGDE